MKAYIRGTEIYFDVAGMQIEVKANRLVEKPILFLIHGGPGGNHLHFKSDSIKLQRLAQLIFIDQRGCGWSKKGKQSDYTLENNIEDIEALRQYLGLNKICVLGFSYGGIVAQGYAIRYPKNISKLILVATAPSYHFIEEAKQNLQRMGTKEQIAVCNQYLWPGRFNSDKKVNDYFEIMKSLYYFNLKTARKKLIANKKPGALKSEFSYEALNAGFGGFLQHFDFTKQLRKITCPSLIMAGRHDWICSPNQSAILAKNIKKSTLKIFEKASHKISSDVNAAYIKCVKDFLKKA